MDVRPLVKAIAAAMMLLEHSPDDELDPDLAVRGLEWIAHELLQLAEGDRAEFRRLIESVAEQEPDEPTATFIRTIPFSLGLTEEPPGAHR